MFTAPRMSFRLFLRQKMPSRSTNIAVSCRKITTQNVKILPASKNTANIQIEQKRFSAHEPLTLKTVEDRIMLVLHLYDKIDSTHLTLDADFFKDLGLDSLDFVDVIMAIEDEFRFEIPDGDSDRMKTPRDIFQYICDRNDVYG